MPAVSLWHQPGRTKRCIRCGESLPLGDFYSYGYTTRQGRRSTRYESRCRPCARARRVLERNIAKEAESGKRWRTLNREASLDGLRRYRQSAQGKRMRAKAQRLRKARMRSGQGNTPAIKAVYTQQAAEQLIVDRYRCPVFDLPELGRKLHVDHRIPLARGGRHEAANLQIIPIGINMRKGVRCPL